MHCLIGHDAPIYSVCPHLKDGVHVRPSLCRRFWPSSELNRFLHTRTTAVLIDEGCMTVKQLRKDPFRPDLGYNFPLY